MSTQETNLKAIADAIRTKEGSTDTIPANTFAQRILGIQTGVELPELTTPGAAADLLAGKELIDADGNKLTGTMPTVEQATPAITVSSSGLITASGTQSAGYVAAGTKSATKQLTTQAAKTITPSTSAQTAVASGKYTTGAVTVAGDANLVAANIVSGKSIFGVAGSAATGINFEIRTHKFQSAADMLFAANIGFKPNGICVMKYTEGTQTEGSATNTDIAEEVPLVLLTALVFGLRDQTFCISSRVAYTERTVFETSTVGTLYTFEFTDNSVTIRATDDGFPFYGTYSVCVF